MMMERFQLLSKSEARGLLAHIQVDEPVETKRVEGDHGHWVSYHYLPEPWRSMVRSRCEARYSHEMQGQSAWYMLVSLIKFKDGGRMTPHSDYSRQHGPRLRTVMCMLRPSEQGNLVIEGYGDMKLDVGEAVSYKYPTVHWVTEVKGGPRWTVAATMQKAPSWEEAAASRKAHDDGPPA